MLFSLKEFEHFFSEATLRKGLQLFEAGKITVLPERIKENRIFQVGSKKVNINKRGEKVLSYSCTCSKSYYCEHLAALAFYFQRDTFREKSNSSMVRKLTPVELYDLALKETKNKELKNFFKTNVSDISQADLIKIFSSDVANDFELYLLKWKISFKPYFRIAPLENSDIDKILRLITSSGATASDKNEKGFFDLALLIELSELLGRRFNGDENRIKLFCKSLCSDVTFLFSKAINESSKATCMRATIKLLKTDHLFYETLLFLLPRVLNLSRSRSFFTELAVLLEHRRYKRKYSEPFDNLLIAKWMLRIKQKQVFKTIIPQNSDNESIEYHIALSEMFFCAGKVDKGFKVLEDVYGKWNNHQKRKDHYFRDYMIQKAVEHENAEKEGCFLKEALIFDLYILPDKLHRYLKSLDKTLVKSELDSIVAEIRTERSPLSQDKVNTLLFETGRLDDLIEELKKQGGAFLTLHKVLLLKWPYYDDQLLNVYFKQLMEAFFDKRVFHRAEDLFSFSMEYLGKLPDDEKENIKEKILGKLGGRSAIHKFVAELFSAVTNRD